MALYFVTSNNNKVKEFKQILGIDIERFDVELEELQTLDVDKVVEHKAREAFKLVKGPVIVEDTGLYCEGLERLPGALVKVFEKTIGYGKLCKILGRNRKATARTVIGYTNGKEYKQFAGEIKGIIARKPRGKSGFGWDSIFIPKGFKKTFGEMTKEAKNGMSMRKIALEKLRKFIGSIH